MWPSGGTRKELSASILCFILALKCMRSDSPEHLNFLTSLQCKTFEASFRRVVVPGALDGR